MMACPMGMIIRLRDKFFILGLYYDDYGLIHYTLSTYVFPVMACPMGMIIRL